EHQPAQTKQRAAAVATVIEPAREPVQHRLGHQASQHRERSALEFLLQKLGDQRGEPFGSLERDVAHESVANDDVDLALENVVAFDVAAEVHVPSSTNGAQQLAAAIDGFV